MFKEKLREIRKKQKMTQDDVAEHLGILRQSYSAYERGISVPDTYQLKKLADFFKVPTDYFFGGVNPGLPTAQNDQEKQILMLFRRAEKIPSAQREKLIKGFEDNIDLFLEVINAQ
ncbi:MAG: helix-turn-helix domain-containing protein [Oscillospiraceae bacterium]|nr:helix-turn-helix domain-containing protein [Oscillospiraceae bacterium]